MPDKVRIDRDAWEKSLKGLREEDEAFRKMSSERKIEELKKYVDELQGQLFDAQDEVQEVRNALKKLRQDFSRLVFYLLDLGDADSPVVDTQKVHCRSDRGKDYIALLAICADKSVWVVHCDGDCTPCRHGLRA